VGGRGSLCDDLEAPHEVCESSGLCSKNRCADRLYGFEAGVERVSVVEVLDGPEVCASDGLGDWEEVFEGEEFGAESRSELVVNACAHNYLDRFFDGVDGGINAADRIHFVLLQGGLDIHNRVIDQVIPDQSGYHFWLRAIRVEFDLEAVFVDGLEQLRESWAERGLTSGDDDALYPLLLMSKPGEDFDLGYPW